jgi:hypothetical protein
MAMAYSKKIFRILVAMTTLTLASCTDYQNETIKLPQPKVSKPTATLEAEYVATAPNSISSAYWKTANYLPITSQNLVTGQVPPDDGLYNVSGTYNGLASFNLGKPPKATIKAAYDNSNLYILVSWRDTTFNLSSENWVYNGPSDPKKAGSTSGWTSQRSDDKMILSFDMGSSNRDEWTWSLALSEPLGFAIDMINNNGVVSADAGNKTYVRNIAGADDRSGPKYQWDEVQQQLTRTPGGTTILDPGFYILTKTNFVGDPASGETIFQNSCSRCHGVDGDGNGIVEAAAAFSVPGDMNRFTKLAFVTFASSSQHDGSTDFVSLTPTEVDNIFARIRGFAGVPGYYLQNPSGSNSDVHTLSNVLLANVDGNNNKGYTVLLIRALNTGNTDDIVFDPTVGQYQFNILLSDNDELNRIGANNNTITFKPKP